MGEMGLTGLPDAFTGGGEDNPAQQQYPNETAEVSDASQEPGAEGLPEHEVRP